jgi:SulP family sulfate permease
MFVPQLVQCLRSFNRRQVAADLTAGVVVGIVALPLAMAFAIASGVTPERGLYTAIVAGFLISALGGSRVQIGGPTGAFVVIVYDIVQRYGVTGLTVCTIMAGVLLIGLGLARLGGIIKYIPHPVITGFTSGIAVIIFSAQIKDLLGLTPGPLPGDFLGKWAEYFHHLDTLNGSAVVLSALCLGILVYWPKRWRRVPASVVAMVGATVLVHALNLPVETIGSRFGGIPATLPALSWPEMTWAQLRDLVGPAVTVAMLAGIESLLSAVVADGMTGYRHKSNLELVAQGVANLFSPLFGGIPATGAIARTATNVRSGGTTPLAGITHAATLFAIMLVFGRWASLVPLCSLAAVLVIVAYNMSEWRTFRGLLRTPRGDVVVLVTTFGVTVLFDLTLAVEVGVGLALFLFVKHMADATRVGKLTIAGVPPSEGNRESAGGAATGRRVVPAGVEVYAINGPFFFGAADKLRQVSPDGRQAPRVLILQMQEVPVIDATGLHALEQVHQTCARTGTALVLCGVHDQPLQALRRVRYLKAIGKENVARNLDEALGRAGEILRMPPSQILPFKPRRKKGSRRPAA